MSSRVVSGGVVHAVPMDLRKQKRGANISSDCDPNCWRESGGRVVGLAARIERTRN